MKNVDKVIEAFVNGDYFIIFLVIVLVILLVLVLALIKSREDYNELLNSEQKKDDDIIGQMDKTRDEEDLMSDLTSLMAETKDDEIDANKPLIKQIDLKHIKTYDELIDEYQSLEEENAVISAEELEKRKEERLEILGSNENQEAINKYEEEQEKKAIISYEQLMQNASNITLSYKEEESKDKDAPKVNKVELEQKEVTNTQMYIEEEEFLKILKEFRISLE